MESFLEPLRAQQIEDEEWGEDESEPESDVDRAEARPLESEGDYTWRQAMVYREGRRSSVTGKMKRAIRHPLNGAFIVKIEDTNEHGRIATDSPWDLMIKKPTAPKPEPEAPSILCQNYTWKEKTVCRKNVDRLPLLRR